MEMAEESAKSEPAIVGIYVFPSENEVRLLEVDRTMRPSGEAAEAYYFAADAQFPFPSGIAIIRPDEVGKIQPPEGWGEWADAQEIFTRKTA
ncbi:hypothetical protein BH09SUM1_BH09SUM1_33050 [soil metagenome]